MDRLKISHIKDVNVNILIGGQFDDLLFGLLGIGRVPADEMDDAPALGDFNCSLELS
jgi:hypothetical protein